MICLQPRGCKVFATIPSKKNQYKIAMNDHILSGNAIFKAKIKISAHIDF